MKGKTGFERLWAGCDNLLLLAVFVLLGVVWYSTIRTDAALTPAKSAKGEVGRAGTSFRRFVPPPQTVDGLRVSTGRTRMNTIARSMVASGWERAPRTPALDMRENGKTYEVLFALPDEFVKESVRVTAAGNVLTLTMKASETGKTYMRRIRIPCGVDDRADAIQTSISNDVLHVHILPPKG